MLTPRHVKLSTTLAVLLLALSGYGLYWEQTRGAFRHKRAGTPINISVGALLKVPFSVAEKGDHDVEIQYASDASEDVGKDLQEVTGRATLTSSGALLAQANLPVLNERFAKGNARMVLFTLPMEPRKDYVLSLAVDQVPENLSGSQAKVVVELQRII